VTARRPEGVFIDQGAAAGLERVQCVVRAHAASVPSVFCVGAPACVLCACYVVVVGGGGGARALRMLYSVAVRVRRPCRAAPWAASVSRTD